MDTLDSEPSALRKLLPLFEELSSKLSLTSSLFEEDIGETRSELPTLSPRRSPESADQFEFDWYLPPEELESSHPEPLRRFFNTLDSRMSLLHPRDQPRLSETPSWLPSMLYPSLTDSSLPISGPLPLLERLPSRSTLTSSSPLQRIRTIRRARRSLSKIAL